MASLFSDWSDYHVELVAAGVSGDLAYTVGYERSMVSVHGGPLHAVVLRVTHVYRRENGEWKIIHRHGDYLPSDYEVNGRHGGVLKRKGLWRHRKRAATTWVQFHGGVFVPEGAPGCLSIDHLPRGRELG